MEISAKQGSDKVNILQRRYKYVAEADDILVLEMLEKFQLAVCTFGQDCRRKRFRYLFYGDLLLQ